MPASARLPDGDPSTEIHFVNYFSQLLQLKLRARYPASEVVDDLRQETFTRVIRTLRSESSVHEPDRLGAFLNSVCNNVLLEHYRSGIKIVALDPNHAEIQDKTLNVENLAITDETCAMVRKVLSKLSQTRSGHPPRHLSRGAGQRPGLPPLCRYPRYRDSFICPQDPREASNPDGQKLYSTLIQPIANLIPANSRVMILPDGGLHSLNFETLIVSDPQPHYWIEDATLITASSLSQFGSWRFQSTPRPGTLLRRRSSPR